MIDEPGREWLLRDSNPVNLCERKHAVIRSPQRPVPAMVRKLSLVAVVLIVTAGVALWLVRQPAPRGSFEITDGSVVLHPVTAWIPAPHLVVLVICGGVVIATLVAQLRLIRKRRDSVVAEWLMHLGLPMLGILLIAAVWGGQAAVVSENGALVQEAAHTAWPTKVTAETEIPRDSFRPGDHSLVSTGEGANCTLHVVVLDEPERRPMTLKCGGVEIPPR